MSRPMLKSDPSQRLKGMFVNVHWLKCGPALITRCTHLSSVLVPLLLFPERGEQVLGDHCTPCPANNESAPNMPRPHLTAMRHMEQSIKRCQHQVPTPPSDPEHLFPLGTFRDSGCLSISMGWASSTSNYLPKRRSQQCTGQVNPSHRTSRCLAQFKRRA